MSKGRPLPVFSDALVGGDASFLSFDWDFEVFLRVAMVVERRTNGRTRDKDFFSTRPRRVRAAGWRRPHRGRRLRRSEPWRRDAANGSRPSHRPPTPWKGGEGGCRGAGPPNLQPLRMPPRLGPPEVPAPAGDRTPLDFFVFPPPPEATPRRVGAGEGSGPAAASPADDGDVRELR